MKKLIALIILGSLVFSLTACDLDLDMFLGSKEPEFERVETDRPMNQMVAIGGDGNIGEGDVSIIYKSDGNGTISIISPDKIKPEVEVNQEEPTEESVSAQNLIGEWQTATRNGDVISTRYYSFSEDGSFYSTDCEYMYSASAPELFPGFDDGWYTVPMGFPAGYGTYEISGNQIVLSYTHEDYAEPYEEPVVRTVTVYALSDDEAVFGNEWVQNGKDTFIRYDAGQYEGDFLTYLCERLDVNMEP